MPDVVHIPRSDAPRVSIVVPSAAAPDLLLACLESLEKHLPASIPTETIVVLDGAPGGAAERVESAAPGVLVVTSTVRLGLARAGNRGRRRARGEFVALLHDDSEIDAGWLEALVAAAESHPEAGAFGGFIAFPDGAPQTAGVTLFRDGAALPPWGTDPALYDFGTGRAVDFCASNALFVRAVAWDAAGGMDPRFFPAYFVDADFAMALRAAGWTVRFVPSATSRHRRGASSRREFREWVSGRNRGAFVEKWADALKDHEPWDGGSPESFRRALVRAQERAGDVASNRDARRIDSPSNERERESDGSGERRALEQDLALQRAWARTLAARLDESTARCDASTAQREALTARLEESAARLSSVEGLLWWRLYVRLLPFLRPLRRVASRLSRRGAPSRTE